MFNHCIIINIDGCRRDLFYDLLCDGKLPLFKRIFGSGLHFMSATTVFPTASFADQASAVTGTYPARHGILSNMWMNRQADGAPVFDYTGNFVHAARVYRYSLFGFPHLFFADNVPIGLADEHLSPQVKTIYEEARIKSFSSINAFHQFARGVDYWVRPSPSDMIRYFFGSRFPSQFQVFDESMSSRLIKKIEKNGQPGILLIYFAPSDGTDNWLGKEGQSWYLRVVVEEKLSKILKSLEKKGNLDSTLFVMMGDHGHTDVIYDKEHCISLKWISKILGKFRGYDSVSNHKSRQGNAVVAMEGGMAGIYLRNLESKKWKDYPDGDLLNEISAQFIKESGERLGAVIFRDPMEKIFKISPGDNPMNLDLEYIIKKINIEYYHQNSPDIMLFSNYSAGYHFYKEPLYATHGNVNPEDFKIPLIFSGNGVKSGENKKPVSIVDVAPTIANAMGFKMSITDGITLNLT